MANRYVDCDGHVMERVDEIAERIGRANGIEGEINPRRMVPSLDRFHTPRLQRRTPGTFDPSIGPEKWMEFLDRTGLEYSVLFPTEGLAYGQISLAAWAVAYARGYNDWLYEKYLKFSPKLKGVALIPMQDVPPSRKPMRSLGNRSSMPSTIMPVAAIASGKGIPRARVAGNTPKLLNPKSP